MNVQIEESWKQQLAPEFEKDYFVRLTDFVREEYRTTTIYPPGKLIFNAFNLCPFHQAKVVIIGQDPYHGPGQAHGLCFSVNDGVPFPPSLQNIFKATQKTESCLSILGRVILLNRHLSIKSITKRTLNRG